MFEYYKLTNRCWKCYPGVSCMFECSCPWWLSPVLFCTEQHTVLNRYFPCSLRFLILMFRKLHVLYSLRYTLQNLKYTQKCTLKAPCLHLICMSLSPRMSEACFTTWAFVCRHSSPSLALSWDSSISPAGTRETGFAYSVFYSAHMTAVSDFFPLGCLRIAYLN